MEQEHAIIEGFDYSEGIDEAGEYLRQTLALIKRFSLVPNPLNFTLFYEHVAGRNQELSQVIQEMANPNNQISKEAAIELFQRFILPHDQRLLEEQRNRFDRVMSDTLSGVGESADKATASSAMLGDCSDKLNKSSDLNEIRHVVSEVVVETRTMAKNGQQLNAMLNEMKTEVENLREEVARSRKQATTDALTGLLNRRGFDAKLLETLEESNKSRTNLSLLFLDIDMFKRINDSHGHLVGDKVIRFVANQLTRSLKGRDVVARIGGEEYAVLLPETRIDQARIVAESIRQVIERTNLKRMDTNEPIGSVTVSVGVATYKCGENSESFLKRADDALYASKNAGRNRVSLQP